MEEVSVRIVKKLDKLGIRKSKVPEFQLAWLEQIENNIMSIEKSYEDGIDLVKGAKISVKSIADNLGCSRTTFYNYDKLLKNYVELSAEEFEKKKKALNSEGLQERIHTLENQVQKMLVRDVEIGVLKSENKKLEARVATLENEKEELYKRYAKLVNSRKGQ